MELTTFYKNLVSLCAKNKLSVSGAAKAIGLSNAAANGWKKGKMPNDTSREKLANLLHVSVGELMGDAEPEQKESAHDPKIEGARPQVKALFDFIDTATDQELDELIRYAQYLTSKR